jgi:hypothetical protein
MEGSKMKKEDFTKFAKDVAVVVIPVVATTLINMIKK